MELGATPPKAVPADPLTATEYGAAPLFTLQEELRVQAWPLTVVAPLPGSWALVAAPLRLAKVGWAQLALPEAAMPVEKLLPEHWDGAAAKAVAVAALPEVLLVIEAGKSDATKLRKEGLPLAPLGLARMLLAV